MTRSINQPWAISEKYIKRYGETWANLDFEFESKISAENFKTDPMNCTIGHLCIFNQKLSLHYKDLINLSKNINTLSENVYAQRPKQDDVFYVDVKGYSFSLRKHEIGKLAQTLIDALEVSMKKYELGLYL